MRLSFSGLLLCFFAGQAFSLTLADKPLFLSNGSVPNVVMMLDDSGSMQAEILSRPHHSYCQYLEAKDPYPIYSVTYWSSNATAGDKVCFYSGENYTGTKTCYGHSKNSIGTRNDTWSSVRIKPGFSVRVYQHGSANGDVAVITKDRVRMPEGFDNQVSSFRLHRSGTYSTCQGFYPWGYIRPYNQTYNYMFEGYSEYNSSDIRFFDEENGDWRIFSSDMNVTYYNPDESYRPWIGLSDASFTSARSHPVSGVSGYSTTRNLTGVFYVVADDSAGFTGSFPTQAVGSYSSGANGQVDAWDDHTIYQLQASAIARWRVTYSVVSDSLDSNIVRREERLTNITDSAQIAAAKQNYANWYQYSRRRLFGVNSAVGSLIDSTPDYRYALGYINQSSMVVNAPDDNSDLDTHNRELLDELFSSYSGAGGTPLRSGLDRVGSYLSTSGTGAPIIDSCQQNFAVLFSDGYWNDNSFGGASIGNSDNDPYSVTVADVAHHYYSNDLRDDLVNDVPPSLTDSAEHQHLSTFTVAFGVEGNLTDSDSDGWPDSSGTSLIESSDWGNPFSSESSNKINDLWHAAFNSKGLYASANTPAEVVDGLTNALAEVSRRIGSAASVATNAGSLRSNSRIYQARFNSTSWTGDLWAIPLGDKGQVGSSPDWQASTQVDATSAENRVIITADISSDSLVGKPFRNDSDTQLTAAFAAGMSSLGIVGEQSEYISALVNYLRGDDENENSEDVQTNWVNCASEWGSCAVTGTRTVRFGMGNSWNTQVVTGSVNCTNNVFGDPSPGNAKTCEYAETTNYGFRSRPSKLGDFVHSDPVYTGPPSSLYSDPTYQAFKTAHAGRTPVIYVGGNDGMLHGFDADNGNELLAFVPYSLSGAVHKLADPNYSHNYFVDGQQTVADVCTGTGACSWKTLLAGSLRAGGRGIYALDVTSPENFSESSAEDIFLWEFSDRDSEGSDMGFTFGKPLIARMANGRWAVIVANGYNSANGKAVLYILDAATGQPLTTGGKIVTGSGSLSSPNGLSSPTAIDTDQDGDVDFVYAGDLHGNMWKFDVSSSTPSEWGVAYSSGNTPLPLFSGGNDHPVTVPPTIGRHPIEEGYMVYFGTGQYLEISDNLSTGQVTQSFFGIWDDGRENVNFTSAITSSSLLVQEIVAEHVFYPVDTNGDGTRNSSDEALSFRSTSDNEICWSDCGPDSAHRGWMLQLAFSGDNRGEKQVTRPILRNGRIIFTTLQPSSSTCDNGGKSWLMELSAVDGSSLPEPPFDINRDGEFDEDDVDYANWTTADITALCPEGKCQSPSGILSDGFMQAPAIISCATGTECKYLSGSAGNVNKVDENAGGNSLGRQSWRELRGD